MFPQQRPKGPAAPRARWHLSLSDAFVEAAGRVWGALRAGRRGQPGGRWAEPGCGRPLRGRRPEAPRAPAPADPLRSLLQMYRLTLRTSKETVSQRLCELLSEQF